MVKKYSIFILLMALELHAMKKEISPTGEKESSYFRFLPQELYTELFKFFLPSLIKTYTQEYPKGHHSISKQWSALPTIFNKIKNKIHKMGYSKLLENPEFLTILMSNLAQEMGSNPVEVATTLAVEDDEIFIWLKRSIEKDPSIKQQAQDLFFQMVEDQTIEPSVRIVIIVQLIYAGISPNSRNKEGNTPLEIALKNQDRFMMEVFSKDLLIK